MPRLVPPLFQTMNHAWSIILLLSLLFASPAGSAGDAGAGSTNPVGAYLKRADLQDFMQYMVRKHGFSRAELTRMFGSIRPRPDIIDAISHPAEAKPWYEYRPIFLTEARIQGGLQFWKQNQKTLQRAEKELGIPAHIIVAILGVETRYGEFKGKHGVLESLTTLTLDYPKRARFFRSELEQFLLLTREEGVDPLSLKGSYAGAMGGPQFISSSIRRFAIDFDGDGKRDLWNNPVDMIGSVANYFRKHGWKTGEPVLSAAVLVGKDDRIPEKNELKPRLSSQDLQKMGIQVKNPAANAQKAALIRLQTREKPEFWIGYHNFYVITRYNHSELYAMAVYQLGTEIARRRNQEKN